MNISLSVSAIQLINSAQHKSTQAAEELATLSVQNNKAGSAEFNPTDIPKSILSLKTAELETSSAVKLLETDHIMLGALLDIQV